MPIQGLSAGRWRLRGVGRRSACTALKSYAIVLFFRSTHIRVYPDAQALQALDNTGLCTGRGEKVVRLSGGRRSAKYGIVSGLPHEQCGEGGAAGFSAGGGRWF